MSLQALYTAGSGMQAMQTQLAVIANNLANSQTTAFKRGMPNFEDLFYHQEKFPGTIDQLGQRTAVGIAVGTGARLTNVENDQTQGAMNQTGQQLDVAIQGPGYFKVQDPSGDTLYTRDGNFSLNANGNIVMASSNVGRLLQPSISIPQGVTAIQISPEGVVTVQQPNQTQMQSVGQIELVNFVNPQGLLSLGGNLYSQTDASGNATTANPGQNGMGTLMQSSLEASNVEPVSELVSLITTQRSFELNSQCVQACDQMLQLVANLRHS